MDPVEGQRLRAYARSLRRDARCILRGVRGMVDDTWSAGRGAWFAIHDVRGAGHGVRYMMCGARGMVCDTRCAECGALMCDTRCAECGALCVMHGVRSAGRRIAVVVRLSRRASPSGGGSRPPYRHLMEHPIEATWCSGPAPVFATCRMASSSSGARFDASSIFASSILPRY